MSRGSLASRREVVSLVRPVALVREVSLTVMLLLTEMRLRPSREEASGGTESLAQYNDKNDRQYLW